MIMTLAIVIVVISGSFLSYANPYYSNFAAERVSADELEYSIDSNLSLNYTAISMDNGGLYDIKQYVAFYDDEYVGYDMQNTLSGLQWLKYNLEKYRINLLIMGADDIENIVKSYDTSTALIFATNILPSGIYSGGPMDPLLQWLGAGGVMYWMNGKIGGFYAERGGEPINVPNFDMLFFGNNGVSRLEGGHVFNRDLVEGSLTDITGIYFNECTDGLNTNNLISPSLKLDYSYDGYSSVTFVKYYYGDGMICNLGGALTKNFAPAVAQTIASGLTYASQMIDFEQSQISINPTGRLLAVSGTTDVFIYIGKMNIIGGQFIRLT